MRHPETTIKSLYQQKKGSNAGNSAALAKLRKEIDTLDGNICSALSRRFTLTQKVAKIKHELEISVYDAKREKIVLDKIKAHDFDPAITLVICRLYKLLFALSKKYQCSLNKKSKR